MKDYLSKIHANLKDAWCNLIAYEVTKRGGGLTINYEHPVIDEETHSIPELKNIHGVKMVDGICLAHIYYIDVDTLEVEEKWAGIRDLSMDELYEIADRL